MKTIDVPDLDHDRTMLNRYGHKVTPQGRLERRIVAALCAHLASAGWLPRIVYDGCEEIGVSNAKQAMELIFNLDEARVYFSTEDSERTHWVKLVLGNGCDIVSDYSYGADDTFKTAMATFDPEEYA